MTRHHSIQTKQSLVANMSKRSPILKMLSDAEDDRKIAIFPGPYLFNITPYKRLDFSDKTKTLCANNGAVLCGLKICKIIILGDVCVGKTCLVNRFCHQIFDANYKATIGVDFEVEKFDILSVPFNLQIWDTAGQERFKCIAQSYYRAAHVVVVAFDLSNIATLSHCKTWMKEALDANSMEPFKFLIGTKKDLLSDASYKVVENYAMKIAKNLNAEYWPISSKTGENIGRMFFRMAALTFDKVIIDEFEKNPSKTFIGSDLISMKKHRSKDRHRQGCANLKCN